MKFCVTQFPAPGKSFVMYCGDCAQFILESDKKMEGRAWVRTNLGAASIARREIINRVENDEIKLDEAWMDIEMQRTDEYRFSVSLPLHETGFFQAKCFFIPKNSSEPVWPDGDNCIINVEPAGTCCANIIYNAFVRQFGRTRSGYEEDKSLSSVIRQLDAKGYTVIPESGKFRDLKDQVQFIFEELGCRVLSLLPIHPTPTTYARMGRFGSPYAALNFTQVDPALAEFDPSATPLEQFMELVDMVHFHNGYLFLDIAINHTGWAASIHETNPEWLLRGEDGKIQVPGAWGVVWADLTRLDYSKKDLWKYMADVFLLWCHRGVDGFRCDAGYMIPLEAWEYIVAKVRQEYPEILFFFEGLGGPVEATRNALTRANINWAYSELFQNYTRKQICDYFPVACDISDTCGHVIHFAETHDNNRLASVSFTYAKMRTALCALFSVCGGFGFANGVEWFATRKIDVHDSTSLNWGSRENQVGHIARLNLILKYHPVFFSQARLALIQKNTSECLVLLRSNAKGTKKLLVLVNLDCENPGEASWDSCDADMDADIVYDLLTCAAIKIKKQDSKCIMRLTPGEVLALTPDASDLDMLDQKLKATRQTPDKVYIQKLKAKVLAVHIAFNGYGNFRGKVTDRQALEFAADPVEFIRAFNMESNESRVIVFDVKRDLKRQVMIPPGFFLMIRCHTGFRAEILDESKTVKKSMGYEEGISFSGSQGFFALFFPKSIRNRHREFSLSLRVFEPEGTRIEKGRILYLAEFDSLYMRSSFTRKEIVKTPFLKLLSATETGAMMRAAAFWGRLDSRYDALLGANFDTEMPEDRWMVFSRCRIWAVFQGYSRELALDCLEKFTFSHDHGGKWRFHVPTSEGKYYAIELYLGLDPKDNHLVLTIARPESPKDSTGFLEDEKKVTLILRPDIENRSFHDVVKAFTGPETQWPEAVEAFDRGFLFSLHGKRKLRLAVSRGKFVHEPEWHYMVHRPLEATRGLDPDSDLFSPGYFIFSCLGGETAVLDACVADEKSRSSEIPEILPEFSDEKALPLSEAVYKSLEIFLVKRNSYRSVIAGYPWFLDWGRDSLIFCRALIELGRLDDAKSIVKLFGSFEDKGSLPNMICGHDAANIETSDAPLWFFSCCKDIIDRENSRHFLGEKAGSRTIGDILTSIADSLLKGTKTGVVADSETMLLYSPSHFTWMDTNFPAGTPRQGYPVEIQALWYNAMCFMASIDSSRSSTWQKRANKLEAAVLERFYIKKSGYFSDCLHCTGPSDLKNAVADDALRPNQLFLISLGLVRDKRIMEKCVETCLELLVPGGIRSLADRKLEIPVEIFHNGRLVKDPHYPYSGRYEGDEDSARKPAYHNGTAWTWQLPVFCEAWAETFGKSGAETCLAWLGSAIALMRKGAAGYIPEILDGDYPHTPRGCDAQAWASSETARVIHRMLNFLEQEKG